MKNILSKFLWMTLGALIFFVILVGKTLIMPNKVMFSVDDSKNINAVIQELEHRKIPHGVYIEIAPEYRDEVKMIVDE